MNRKIKGSIIFLFLFSLISCSHLSQKDLEDKLLNNSFLLVNKHNDTTKVEFRSDELTNYSWNFFITDEWCVKEINHSLYLKIDFVDYKLMDYYKNMFVFSRDDVGFKLIKQNQRIFNKKLLVGTWIEEDDLLFNPALNLCPNNLKLQMPHIIFKNDSCIVNADCSRKKRFYRVNEVFGFIVFDNARFLSDQWEIISLNADTLVVNKRYHENSEVKYEDNKKFIRVH